MKDEKIISLFFKRDERALDETEKKYGNLIRYIASNILSVPEDAEDCVNDVYLALWNSIPPTEPQSLSAFISEVTRRQAIKKLRHNKAEKRGGFSVVCEEFLSMLDDGTSLSELYEAKRAGEIINAFLGTLETADRRIFILRFWMGLGYADIARQVNCTESKVKVSIHRSRKKLAEMLEKEGITV